MEPNIEGNVMRTQMTESTSTHSGEEIRVRGLVQGVGFRPTVWRLARDSNLHGDVRNDAEGVLIRVWGRLEERTGFLQRLKSEAPPLSRIDTIERLPLTFSSVPVDFQIVASDGGKVHTGVVADAAICAACLQDISDPNNRRYRYAFANCTHCGPRLSIVKKIPYDRKTTSMGVFTLCTACQAEYEDPADRRFHAQPNACSECGPRMWLEQSGKAGEVIVDGDVIQEAQRLLQSGCILAVKGLGGIHLACDASNEQAVGRLRERKQRQDKPFALMARDTAMIQHYCHINTQEDELLHTSAAPIVLLKSIDHHSDGALLSELVAPKLDGYGFMLPYSPMHQLLMDGLDAPIVLTSANRSNEPQYISNTQARDELLGVADFLLLHDRDIVNRLDDSVAKVIANKPALIRRARGYAPVSIILPDGFSDVAPVLAYGGELKNTFCLLKGGEATLSQHLGDLTNPASHRVFQETLQLYSSLFQHQPQVLAIDNHPDYLPSQLGRLRAETDHQSLVSVQHHHAHIAACLVDNGIDVDTRPLLGIALDGTGFGDDGSVWGGEFLLANYHGYRRIASFMPVMMPGATQAIRQPWRMAYAYLTQVHEWHELTKAFGHLPFFQALQDKPLATLNGMMTSGLNCPLSSSCGRLFDAVAAVMGFDQTVSYEGQAAIQLEALVDVQALHEQEGYSFKLSKHLGLIRLDPQPMWLELLEDLNSAVSNRIMAARFHIGLAQAIAQLVDYLKALHDQVIAERVALSGGVFQNAVLSSELSKRLEANGWSVLTHKRVPANDGGLSLGQAVVAAAQNRDS